MQFAFTFTVLHFKKKQQSPTLLSLCEPAVARDFKVCIFSKTRLTFLLVVSSLSLLLQTDKNSNLNTNTANVWGFRNYIQTVVGMEKLIPRLEGVKEDHGALMCQLTAQTVSLHFYYKLQVLKSQTLGQNVMRT